MRIMLFISNLMVPLIFMSVIVLGLLKKVKVYDVFIEGAVDGIKTVSKIVPTLIGLMVAVGILRASGALDIFIGGISPFTNAFS